MCSIQTLAICTVLALFTATATQAQGCSDAMNFNGQTQLTDETVYFATDRTDLTQSVDHGPLIYGSAIASFTEETPHGFFDGMESTLEWKASAPQLMPEVTWSANISSSVNSGKPVNGMRPTDSVIVYIHGFANGFHDAFCRAAEMKHRTRFEGQLILFSWPASPTIGARNFMFAGEMYDRDLESSDRSVDDLVQFLNDLQRTIPATRTVLVAHSMGNRLLLHALMNAHLSLKDKYRAVVLLSPDVSTDELRLALPTLDSEAHRVALYANLNDLALLLSMARHLDRRAGATDMVDPSGKMETIDITQATSEEASVLHHADHLDGTALYDLFWNIVRDMPAKCRTERGLAFKYGPVWQLEVQDQPYDTKALDPACEIRK